MIADGIWNISASDYQKFFFKGKGLLVKKIQFGHLTEHFKKKTIRVPKQKQLFTVVLKQLFWKATSTTYFSNKVASNIFKIFTKKVAITDIFHIILWKFAEQLFYRTILSNCIYIQRIKIVTEIQFQHKHQYNCFCNHAQFSINAFAWWLMAWIVI